MHADIVSVFLTTLFKRNEEVLQHGLSPCDVKWYLKILCHTVHSKLCQYRYTDRRTSSAFNPVGECITLFSVVFITLSGFDAQ